MSQFDRDRADFYLLAAVVFAVLFVILGSVAMCWVNVDAIVTGRFKCDGDNKLFEILMGVMAAIFAYAARGRGGAPPPSS